MTVLLTTVDNVKRQLEIISQGTLNSRDDDIIGDYVDQASDDIQRECMRTFGTLIGEWDFDAGYPVVWNNVLYFDQDFLRVDYVINGSNGTITSDKFRLLPVHESPKYGLQLLNSSNLTWVTGNSGYAQDAIHVVGTAGFCTPSDRPSDITLAATRYAAWLYLTRDTDGSTVQVADGATVIPANAPAFVLRTIAKYIRKVAWSEPTNT